MSCWIKTYIILILTTYTDQVDIITSAKTNVVINKLTPVLFGDNKHMPMFWAHACLYCERKIHLGLKLNIYIKRNSFMHFWASLPQFYLLFTSTIKMTLKCVSFDITLHRLGADFTCTVRKTNLDIIIVLFQSIFLIMFCPLWNNVTPSVELWCPLLKITACCQYKCYYNIFVALLSSLSIELINPKYEVST